MAGPAFLAIGATVITVTNAAMNAGVASCVIHVDVAPSNTPTVGTCPQANNTNGAANISGLARLTNGVTNQCVDVTAATPSLNKVFNAALPVGGTDVSELTTHGDHFFYDRLKASPDPAIATSLRFEALAAADTNADGEVTLEELDAAPIDVTTYDPSGFDATTLGAFVKQLVRTVGHFRGEGECAVSDVRP